jgi:hypothetical protein
MLQWAIHICFKCMFNVSSVSDVCCKCFIWMFFLRVSFGYCKTRSGCYKTRSGCCIYMQMFQVFSYVCCKCFILMFAYVCNDYTRVFKLFLVFCKCFRRMLQVFQLDVAKVDRVLHMLQCMWEADGRERSLHAVWQHGRRPGDAGPVWAREMQAQAGARWSEHGKQECSANVQNVRALALPFFFLEAMIGFDTGACELNFTQSNCGPVWLPLFF